LPPYEANFSGGGVLGKFFGDLLQEYLNVQGAVVVLLTLLALSVLATTTFSLQGAAKFSVMVPGSVIGSVAKRWKVRRETKKRQKSESRVLSSLSLSSPATAPKASAAARKAADATGEDDSDALESLLPPPAPIGHRTAAEVRPPEIRTEMRSTPSAGSAVPLSSKFDILRLDKYLMPDVNFLEKAPDQSAINEGELMELARMLQEKSAEFDVHGNITQIHPGPIVTTFEFKPDTGVKYSRIVNLVDDLCLAMKAESIRIDRLPGKSTVGIEVPNRTRDTIHLREIIESDAFRKSKSRLTLALGKLINGDPYVTDLAKMPHLLIAGATGSGKSVGVNAMITSVLYKATPNEVKFIMIDPKRLELGMYADIPHLLTPIVTDPKRASNVLQWATAEMEGRYKRMASHGVRNIDQYNQLIRSTQKTSPSDDEELQTLPYIVVVIDELADLMMLAGKDVEESITRLAQMARAVGIHLILATQRPSVDVITGLIKANFPSRISFRVSSKIDSRTILDGNGAEQLLGHGDMLFLPPGTSRLLRIHGAYISEAETQRIIDFLKSQAMPKYNSAILDYGKENRELEGDEELNDNDPLYDDAVRIVVEMRKASTSVLQRRLKVGYGRAARLIDLMERDGIVGPPDGSKPREVLKPPEYYREVDS
ncbi:MAG TPA: DNA translocase FtsK, partial [Tepidisphaeraceae bacterium]|nr:DNA translocase FtsK [Tepidisphaeraceae bacterium]